MKFPPPAPDFLKRSYPKVHCPDKELLWAGCPALAVCAWPACVSLKMLRAPSSGCYAARQVPRHTGADSNCTDTTKATAWFSRASALHP